MACLKAALRKLHAALSEKTQRKNGKIKIKKNKMEDKIHDLK